MDELRCRGVISVIVVAWTDWCRLPLSSEQIAVSRGNLFILWIAAGPCNRRIFSACAVSRLFGWVSAVERVPAPVIAAAASVCSQQCARWLYSKPVFSMISHSVPLWETTDPSSRSAGLYHDHHLNVTVKHNYCAVHQFIIVTLQCFDTVGWATGRACKKAGCWFVGSDDLTGALHNL